MTPEVTIVVATYNRPEMLKVELDSIFASSARVPEVANPVRVLVVDDCSTIDGAKAIAAQVGVEYLRLSKNRGVAGALATGFQYVESPFYALWGDDDYMLPNWFSLHLAKIAEGYDVVAGSYYMADASLNPTEKVVLPVATFDDLKRGKVTVNDGALVRRDSLGDITFRPERERAMMMTFWLAMAAAGKRFSVVEEPTWLYRRHPQQLTARPLTPHDTALRREAMAEYA